MMKSGYRTRRKYTGWLPYQCESSRGVRGQDQRAHYQMPWLGSPNQRKFLRFKILLWKAQYDYSISQ